MHKMYTDDGQPVPSLGEHNEFVEDNSITLLQIISTESSFNERLQSGTLQENETQISSDFNKSDMPQRNKYSVLNLVENSYTDDGLDHKSATSYKCNDMKYINQILEMDDQ